MISLDNILIAEKDVETVWNFFNNVHSVAQCVPTMVNYEVLDDDTVTP
jgi:carbon monoxide dehydrogenase subunit G